MPFALVFPDLGAAGELLSMRRVTQASLVLPYGDTISSIAKEDQTWKPIYVGRLDFPCSGPGSESSAVSLTGVETF